ncbi:MAG: hypothetical protein E4G99_00735, partial [Anaerolineales bacterium]
MRPRHWFLVSVFLLALLIAGCTPEVTPWIPTATPQEVVDAAMPAAADDHSEDLGVPDVRYTLLTGGGT